VAKTQECKTLDNITEECRSSLLKGHEECRSERRADSSSPIPPYRYPRIEAKRIYKTEISRVDVTRDLQVSGIERGSTKMHEVLDALCRTRMYVLKATGTCRPGLLASEPRLPLKQGMRYQKVVVVAVMVPIHREKGF
jgi:hypothetical protein